MGDEEDIVPVCTGVECCIAQGLERTLLSLEHHRLCPHLEGGVAMPSAGRHWKSCVRL